MGPTPLVSGSAAAEAPQAVAVAGAARRPRAKTGAGGVADLARPRAEPVRDHRVASSRAARTAGEGARLPRLLAIYLDDPARSLAGFRSFLRTQWPLPPPPSRTSRWPMSARPRACGGCGDLRPPHPPRVPAGVARLDAATVYQHFDLRQKVEAEQWNLFTTALMECGMDLRQQFGDALDGTTPGSGAARLPSLAEATLPPHPTSSAGPNRAPVPAIALASTRQRSP